MKDREMDKTMEIDAKKLGMLAVLVVVVIGVVLIIGSVEEPDETSTEGPVITEPTGPDETTENKTIPEPEPEVQNLSLRETFDKIKEAYNKRDIEMYKKYITKDSVELIEQMMGAGWSYDMSTDVTFINESKDDEMTMVRCMEMDRDGNENEIDYIFVVEDGVWKYDEIATIEKAMEDLWNDDTDNSSEQINGFVDLAALDIQVDPYPPRVGDKETRIEVRIKNMGNVSFKETLNYEYRINEWGQVGSFVGVIKPGEIVRVPIPYSFYLFMTGDEEPGEYSIYCELDYDYAINDTNRENNIIEQTIEFIE